MLLHLFFDSAVTWAWLRSSVTAIGHESSVGIVLWVTTVHILVLVRCAGTASWDLAVKARFILALTFHTASSQAIRRSGADPFIIPLPLTRLGLHRKNKAWIYNKYQEDAVLLLTFPAAGKSKCPSAGMRRANLNNIHLFYFNRTTLGCGLWVLVS